MRQLIWFYATQNIYNYTVGKVVHHSLLQNEIILFWLSENEIKRTHSLSWFYLKCYTLPVLTDIITENLQTWIWQILNCIKTWKKNSNIKYKLNKIYLQQQCLWRRQWIKNTVQKCTLSIKVWISKQWTNKVLKKWIHKWEQTFIQ